jgi:tetratricopeptide (TPR) repeat protein
MRPIEATPARARRIALLVAVALVPAVVVVWFATRPNPARLLERGMAITRRDPEKAESLLRRAIAAAGGTYPDAEAGLCLVLARRGDWTAASSQFASLDRESCRNDLLLAFGREALHAGRRTEGLLALESLATRQSPDSIPALEMLMSEYREWGQQDELIAAARRLTQREPDNPQRWATLVALLKAMYRDTECLEAVRQAMKYDFPPDYQNEFRHRLIQQLIVQGDSAAAWKELSTLKESEQESLRIRGYEVDLYRLDGKLDKALETINSLFPQIKDNPLAYYTRGVVYLDLERFDEAARDLERVVAAHPFDARAHYKLAEACRSLGREEPARRHRELAAAISAKRNRINELLKRRVSDRDDPQICEELAELYGDIGEQDAAGQWHRRAAARNRR